MMIQNNNINGFWLVLFIIFIEIVLGFFLSTNLIVLILFVVPITIFMIIHPQYAFYLLILTLPFTISVYKVLKVGFLNLELPDILIFILIIGILARFLIKGMEDFELKKLVKVNISLVALYVLSILIANVSARQPNKNIQYFVYSVGSFLVFLMPIFFIKSIRQYKLALSLFLLTVTILAISIILSAYEIYIPGLENFMSLKASARRSVLGAKQASQGLFASRGGYGVFVSFILPFTILSIWRKELKFREKISILLNSSILVIVVILILLSVMLTCSRSTWLAVLSVISGLLFVALNKRYNLSIVAITVGALILLIVLYSLGALGSIIKPIWEIQPYTFGYRMITNYEALKIFARNPLLGIGHGAFMTVAYFPSYMPESIIHNFFLNTAVTSGILGLIPIIFVFIITFYLQIKKYDSKNELVKLFRTITIVGLLGVMIELMFYAGGGKQVWFVLGMANCLYNFSGEENNE